MDLNKIQPKTTVTAIISRLQGDDEYILITKRKINPYLNKWCLPGGHINKYETAKNAVIREVREETGLDYKPKFYNYFDEIVPDENIHAVVLVFTGISGGTLIRVNAEVSDAKWIHLNDTLNYDFAFQHNEILKHYMANKIT
jgi:8-oxo-dGTP diphosphatase